MPRRKISEFRSKELINKELGLPYTGWEVVESKLPKIPSRGQFVIKVDQAVKQRFKRGLIYLDVEHKELPGKLQELSKKGYGSFIVEPYHLHDADAERYISLRREREGVVISYSKSGGVEIEANQQTITSGLIDSFDRKKIAEETGLTIAQVDSLRAAFDAQHMTFLEINPYVVEGGELRILDTAIEVDSAAELLVDGWKESDFRSPTTSLTAQEAVVRKLDSQSPASFNLEVMNPNGAIFLLLSGGGASVVIADEIFTHGYGKLLANYGEYSGNPNRYETELYAEQVVSLLLQSTAKQKVVLIGGAVANFTDIKATFDGIIAVIQKHREDLQKQGIKFYVRRGGPRQVEGLHAITEVLEEVGVMGGVYDPKTSIPTAVKNLVKGIQK